MLVNPRQNLERARDLLSGCQLVSGAAPEVRANHELSSRSLVRILERVRREAALDSAEVHRRYLVGAVGVLLVVVVSVVASSASIAAVGTPALMYVLWREVRSRAFRRAEEFEREYPAFLLSLASAVRTGLDPMVAFARSHEVFPAETEMGRELRATRDLVDQGVREEEVIQRFADTIPHPDIQLFRTALILARREGSSLAECLQRLARVTRQRQSFRRKIRGATAMQRLSSYGILVCAVAIGFMQFASNPQGMAQAVQHPLGFRAVVLGSVLLVSGVALMMHITRTRI